MGVAHDAGEAQVVSMSLPFSAASAAFASLAPAGVMDPLGLGKPVEADMPVMNREDAAGTPPSLRLLPCTFGCTCSCMSPVCLPCEHLPYFALLLNDKLSKACT